MGGRMAKCCVCRLETDLVAVGEFRIIDLATPASIPPPLEAPIQVPDQFLLSETETDDDDIIWSN